MGSPVGSVRIRELDSLRGVAAALVVLGHCYLSLLATIDLNLSLGQRFAFDVALNPQPSVLVFFGLSGFALALQVELMPIKTLRTFGAYLVRRAFRLLPLSWLSILFCVALYSLVGAIWPRSLPDWVTGTQLLNELTFADFKLNAPLWSLVVEIVASVAFPLIYFFSTRLGLPIALLTCVTLLIWQLDAVSPPYTQYLIFFQLGLFASKAPPIGLMLKGPVSVVVAVTLPIFIVAAPEIVTFHRGVEELFNTWAWADLLPVFLLLLAIRDGSFSLVRVLAWPPLVFLGRVSFGLYLFHWPILWSVIFASKQLVDLPKQLELLPWLGGLACLSLMVCLLTLFISIVGYRFIELPMISAGRELAWRVAGYRRPEVSMSLGKSSS